MSFRNWFAGLVGPASRAAGTGRLGRRVRPGRRLELEPLEDRVVPALGDLLHSLPNPMPVAFDGFGQSVAVSGNRVVVGAPSRQAMGADGVGAAYLLDANSGARLQTFNNPMSRFNDTFGTSVAVSGNLVVVGTPNDRAAYLYDATSGALLRPLPSPTPAVGDFFGGSVSVSGNLVVVGAPNDNTGAPNAGAAYLFDATTGALLRTFNNPTPEADDRFGTSVAVSGNLVLVGALRDNTGAPAAGAAYLYDATSGALLRTLLNPTPAANDFFGSSVAVSGNLVLVGALNDDTGAQDAGSAYLLDATSGTLLHTFNNPTPAAGDFFGFSVAVSGNLVVVGASRDDTGAQDAGAVYLYDATSGARLRTLLNPTPATGDLFGLSVAVSDNRVVVGAFSDNTGANDAGAAHVFDAPLPPRDFFAVLAPVQVGKKTRLRVEVRFTDNQALKSQFLSPFQKPAYRQIQVFALDRDQDGFNDAVSVQALRKGKLASRVFSMEVGPSAVRVVPALGDLLHSLPNPPPAEGDSFGYSVAASGNLVVVGAFNDNTGANNAGAAYLLDASSGARLRTLLNPTPAVGDEFGTSVAVSGNFVVVGAPNDSTGASRAGAAYLFDATSGTLLQTFLNPTPEATDFFGTSVAVSGNFVVVGAPNDNTGAEDAGAAYVFDATSGALLKTLLNPTPAAGDSFGYSVAVSGNFVVVGAFSDNTVALDDVGAALFDANSGTLLRALLNPTPGVTADLFGNSVAVSGNRVVVGAHFDDTGATNAGAAYLFDAPLPPRNFFAVLAPVQEGKKTRLQVEVRFADNQALKSQFLSPFQKPAYRQVQVFALDQNQDGLNDAVLVLALRNGKLTTRVFPA